ncbi:hypothetical protein GW916_10670 [bacterium]|nr:hypothetical protein [bacterium]
MKNKLSHPIGKKLILVLGLLVLSPSVGEAQSWRNQYNDYVVSGQHEKALQYLWGRTLRNTRANEHVQRALQMERVGLHLSALREWANAVRANPRLRVAMEGFGQSAIRWDRLGSVNSLVKAANASGVRASSWTPAFKLAASLNALRSGSANAASQWMPTTRGILGIRNIDARIQAALHLASLQVYFGQTRQAVTTLTSAAANEKSAKYGVLRLQAARLYYDLNQFTPSLEQLVSLPRNSGSWYQGVLTGAWSAYRLKDFNLALGQLLTLHSPYLDSKYSPETYVLESATLFQLCHFKSALRSLETLKDKYKGVANAVSRFQRSYTTASSRVNAVIGYARGTSEGLSGIDSRSLALLMDGLLQEEALVRADRILLQVDQEKEKLERFLPNSSNALWKNLSNSYDSELKYATIEANRDAIRAINRKLKLMATDVSVAFENASLVELEVNTKLRERLIRAEVPKKVEVDFDADVKNGYEFWPFEGEFWRDEVGSYAFATTSVCGEGEL